MCLAQSKHSTNYVLYLLFVISLPVSMLMIIKAINMTFIIKLVRCDRKEC